MQDEINEIRAVRNSDGSGIVFIETEDRRLEKHVGNLDDDMDGAQREIELLSEYRTRLIVDVVTGQVDVREATRSLDDGIAEVPSFDESEQA